MKIIIDSTESFTTFNNNKSLIKIKKFIDAYKILYKQIKITNIIMYKYYSLCFDNYAFHYEIYYKHNYRYSRFFQTLFSSYYELHKKNILKKRYINNLYKLYYIIYSYFIYNKYYTYDNTKIYFHIINTITYKKLFNCRDYYIIYSFI